MIIYCIQNVLKQKRRLELERALIFRVATIELGLRPGFEK